MDLQLAGNVWLWTILILLVLGFLCYQYFNPVYSYWDRRGVPHVPAQSAIATLSRLLKKDLIEIELERYKKYGRIYGAFEGKAPVLYVADPDLVRCILVKDFPVFASRRKIITGNPIFDNMVTSIDGEKWKRIRSIISPTFSTGKIKRMTDIIISSAEALTKSFATGTGKPIDVKKFFDTFTMDVIASVAFATKIDSHADPKNRFIQEARKIFPSKIPWRFFLLFLLPLKVLKYSGIDFLNTDAVNFFTEETVKIIDYRRKSGKTRNDFIQLLIDAEKEYREQEKEKTEEAAEKNTDDLNAEELGHEENNAQIFKISKTTKFLSNDELIAQCVLFFIAAHPTTSATLTFATHMLALNPEIQKKLREEVDDVICRHDRKLTYAAIQEMEYLDKVVTETLRMFPPLIRIERQASEDYKLGDTDIVIEKEKLVIIPVYPIQHDPEHYPEPEKFNPERFSTDGKASRHPYSYLAFGAGPRNCVAMRFALMEVKLCLVHIVSQLIIKKSPETKVPLKIFSGLGLLNPKEVLLCFETRENRVFDGLQGKQNLHD